MDTLTAQFITDLGNEENSGILAILRSIYRHSNLVNNVDQDLM